MPAPIYSLLAEELNISEERAQKLLTAMLREVKNRARRQGVRLPNLGTFREEEGELAFEPTDSLARAVNHRFEGLENEDLPRNEEPNRTQDKEGPSTITLGYQDSEWTPIDSADSEEEQDLNDSSQADTEEFQVLSPEEAADTEELQTQEAFTEDQQDPEVGEEAFSSEPSSDTEELYPLVEEVPGTGTEEESPSPETDSSLENTASLSQKPEGVSEDEADPIEGPQPTADPPSSNPDSQAAPPTSQSEEPPQRNSSLTAQILIAPLILLLLGTGWYILAQHDYLPSPTTTFAGLTSQFQDQVQKVPLLEKRASEETGETEENAKLSSAMVSDSEGSQTDSDDGSSDEQTDEETSMSSSDPSNGQPPLEIDPSAGGWTIVVASRTDRTAADSLVTIFRNQFEDHSIPIDIVIGEANNTTRYRVAVGQYDTQSKVLQAIDEYEDKLPSGAWPLTLR